MDAVTSVDDAALPRSRPMLTTLTEQAEMFTLQVPISFDCLRMRICKTYITILLLILLLQVTNTSCASLEVQNYSSKSFNLSNSQRNSTNPKNSSELTEYVPLDFTVGFENITDFQYDDEKASTPKIFTFRLKVHLDVGNQSKNNHQPRGVVKTKIIEGSEIEYLDEDDIPFPKYKHRRSTRTNSSSEKRDVPEDSNEDSKNSSEEDISYENLYTSNDSEENQVSTNVKRSKYAKGRQFLFHPYIPYGKDIAPDEKISFHDILPIKMVKFVKSMVEEADWNGMFKSMVRTVVDHFVNKIIEKMFSEKHDDDHFKKRSLDVLLTPAFVLPTFQTPLVRMKRSVSTSNDPSQEEDIFNFLPPKRLPQEIDKEGEKKSEDERKTWLDHFLDFVFPNSKSDGSDEESIERLRKRDTTNSQLFKILVAFFLNTFEKSSEFLTDAKDVLRYKMLQEFLPYLYQKKYMNGTDNSVDAMKMTHRKFTKGILNRDGILDKISGRLIRRKRSTDDNPRKDEEKRLWQSHSRRHGAHNYRSEDECSLRKACNAGRFLSRLPAVQDITIQLRSDGNEPHWDALMWGMKKKRCSRIFCKRPRSPKGSKYSWNPEKERISKKMEFVTEPPLEDLDESLNLTS